MKPGSRTSPRLHDECGRGIAVGGLNGVVWAVLMGAPPVLVLLAAIGAGAIGALVGVLLWSSTDAPPEDGVLPPDDG